MSGKERKPLTAPDVQMLVMLVEILRKHPEARSISFTLNELGSVHISPPAALKEIADAEGQSISLRAIAGTYGLPWEATTIVAGVTFRSFLRPDELPIIGFEIPETPAVPVKIQKAS